MWGKKEESTLKPDSPSESTQPASEAPSPAPKPAAAPQAKPTVAAQIGRGLKVKGDISGSEDLRIDGEVEGSVKLAERHLEVGPNGRVQADVTAHSVTIEGQIKGNVRALERIEIRKSGSLEGDLVTTSIAIEEGALFRGSIDITKAGQAATAPQAPKKPSPSEKSEGGRSKAAGS